MTSASFTQATFRLRNDDGSETGATWKQAENTNDTINTGANFRVRFTIDETAARAWTGKTWNLYYNLNGAGYNAVTGSTPIQFSASSNFADGDDCTNQLTSPTGTFLANNNGMKETTGGATNTGAAGNYFETEWCLKIDAAQVADNDTITLRIYDGSTPITTYSNTPSITVNEPLAYTLQTTTGSFTLTGNNAIMARSYNLKTTTRAFALSGSQTILGVNITAFWDGPGGTVETYNDTFLSNDNPTTNYGTATYLTVQDQEFNAIVKFTLTAIAGKPIIKSRIYFYNKVSLDATTISCHRIMPANSLWTESGATWNTQDGTNGWSGSAGCNTPEDDFEATALASWSTYADDGDGYEYVENVNLTELAAMASNNYGFTVRSDNTASGSELYSSDYVTTGYRPKIYILFEDRAEAGAYKLQTTTGTFSLTGNQARMLATRQTRTTAGSFTLTGNASILLHSFPLKTTTGTFNWTGNQVIELYQRSTRTSTGTFTWTGNNAIELVKRQLQTTAGTYTWTRSNGQLTRAFRILTTTGTYSLTGNNAILLWPRQLRETTGTFVWTGNDAILTKATLGAYLLQTVVGTFTLTGNQARLLMTHGLRTSNGPFVLTGNQAYLKVIRDLRTTTRAFVLTGNQARLLSTHQTRTSTGLFVWTRNQAFMLDTRKLNTTAGSYTWTRNNGKLLEARSLRNTAGAFSLTGMQAQLLLKFLLRAQQGTFDWTGFQAMLLIVGAVTRWVELSLDERTRAMTLDDRDQDLTLQERTRILTLWETRE